MLVLRAPEPGQRRPETLPPLPRPLAQERLHRPRPRPRVHPCPGARPRPRGHHHPPEQPQRRRGPQRVTPPRRPPAPRPPGGAMGWVSSIVTGAGAAFLACVALTGLLLAARQALRPLRKRPAPGNAPTPPGASAAHPSRAPVPGPGRAARNYRAPGGEDLGPCNATIHHHARGVIIHDHALRRKIVIQFAPGPGDDLAARRLEREVRDQ